MMNFASSAFAFQPMIRVGLVENSGFGIRLNGQYNISSGDDFITYIPLNDDAFVEVNNVQIGKGFHWNRTQNQRFKGIITIRKPNDGSTLLINTLPIEKYLCSVISSEMNPDANIEFLKAHAIISRSWAIRMLSKRNINFDDDRIISPTCVVEWTDSQLHSQFDVCADDHCQRYQGCDNINDKVAKAVEDTLGIVLTDDNNQICDTRFSKCCGGKTELFSSCWQPVDFNYLQPVTDEFCNPENFSPQEKIKISNSILKNYDAETEDFFKWTTSVSKQTIADNLKKYFSADIGNVIDMIILQRGKSGRITKLKIIGDNGEIIIGKELTIRKILSKSHLYSSNFSFENQNDNFILNGKGWGHGVGLCQIGAAIMAERGFSFSEILSFYFQNTKLTKLYEK